MSGAFKSAISTMRLFFKFILLYQHFSVVLKETASKKCVNINNTSDLPLNFITVQWPYNQVKDQLRTGQRLLRDCSRIGFLLEILIERSRKTEIFRSVNYKASDHILNVR